MVAVAGHTINIYLFDMHIDFQYGLIKIPTYIPTNIMFTVSKFILIL